MCRDDARPPFLVSTFYFRACLVVVVIKKRERFLSRIRVAKDGSTRAHSVESAGFYEREEPSFEWDDVRALNITLE